MTTIEPGTFMLTLAAVNAAWIEWLPAATMIAGILVLGVILTISFNRRERQLRSLAAQISSDLEEARALRTQLDEAHALASSMMVSAQRLTARLDERFAALDMASLRMNATRNALPRCGTQSRTRPRSDIAAAPIADSVDPAHSPVFSSVRSALQRPSVAIAAVETAAPPRVAVEMKPNVDSLAQRVYELHDAGQLPVAIARDLNEQIGKVELILALRPR